MKEHEKMKTLMEKLISETENCRIASSEELVQALVNGLDFIRGGDMQTQTARK